MEVQKILSSKICFLLISCYGRKVQNTYEETKLILQIKYTLNRFDKIKNMDAERLY